MSLLRLRRGGGVNTLLVTKCPEYGGIAFSGRLITGHGEREFRGFMVDKPQYLIDFVRYGLGLYDGYLSIGDDVSGYIIVNNGEPELINFKRRDIRSIEEIINADKVRGRILLTPYSEAGASSEVNEDSAAKLSIHDCHNELFWHIGVVADGVGGFGRGDEASKYVVGNFVEKVVNGIINNNRINDDTLRGIVEEIHEELYNEYTGRGVALGSTLAGVVIMHKEGEGEAEVYAVNVGDSPIYLVTRDSIYELYISDKVSGHVISQAIGYVLNEVHVGRSTLYINDYLVLITDGVSDVVEPGRVGEIIEEYKYPWNISRQLVRFAKALGSRDDATALTVWFKG
jgi:serine/threonine protein phosphatase PrpC